MLLTGLVDVSQCNVRNRLGIGMSSEGWYWSRNSHSCIFPKAEMNLLSFVMRIDACKTMSGSIVLVFPTLYEDGILLVPVRSKERKLSSAAARLHFRWSTRCFFFLRRQTQGPTRGGRPSCNTNVQPLP